MTEPPPAMEEKRQLAASVPAVVPPVKVPVNHPTSQRTTPGAAEEDDNEYDSDDASEAEH